jgi:hypothetical protein
MSAQVNIRLSLDDAIRLRGIIEDAATGGVSGRGGFGWWTPTPVSDLGLLNVIHRDLGRKFGPHKLVRVKNKQFDVFYVSEGSESVHFFDVDAKKVAMVPRNSTVEVWETTAELQRQAERIRDALS